MSSNVTPFPSQAGALAPVDPQEPTDHLAIERQEERVNAPRLHTFLNRTLDSIASLDSDENLKIHNAMVKAVAYYDGRRDGKIENGVWVDNATIDGEIIPEDNDYLAQVQKLQMEMCRSRISYMIEPVLRHQAAKKEAAEFAQHRLQINQERIETETFIQAENQSLLLKGTAFRYTFFDKNADSPEQTTELQAVRSMKKGAEVSVCRTCGLTAAPLEPCANCGDTMRKVIAVPESASIETRRTKAPAGRPVTVRPDATMVQLDLNARAIAESSFIRWRLVLRRCDWEAMYPNQKIPSSGESDEARHRSEAQGFPSNSDPYGSTSDPGGGDQFEKIEGELVWLDAKVYQRYRSTEAEKLGKETILPPNTLLSRLFPDGVCVTRIGKKILDLYPSNKNKCWTMTVYGLREHALHGTGTNPLLGPQDIISEGDALILANQVYNSVGRDVVRSGAIEGGNLPPIDKVAYVNDAPQEVGDIAKWAVGKIQPSPLSAEVYGYRQDMKASMQDKAGTSSLGMQGAADLKALGTATGVEASRDQAVGRMIPNRKLQAFAGTEWAQQVLELERENYSPEVFLEMAGKGDAQGEVLYSERGVRTFFNSTVRTDFSIKPVEGSWMPVTPAQETAKAGEFGMIAATLKDAPNAAEILATVAPKFGIDYRVNEFGAAQRAASIRLEEYARICEGLATTVVTPETVQIVFDNCPEWAQVNPVMDPHAAFLDYYEDWWLSDGGRNASSLLRKVIEAVVGLHKDGLVAKGQEKTEMQTATEAPARAAADEAAVQAQQEAHDQAEQDMVKRALAEAEMEQLDREHQAGVETEKEMALNEQEAEIARSAKAFETDQEIRKEVTVNRLAPKPTAQKQVRQ